MGARGGGAGAGDGGRPGGGGGSTLYHFHDICYSIYWKQRGVSQTNFRLPRGYVVVLVGVGVGSGV